jgi:hypothetical protein
LAMFNTDHKAVVTAANVHTINKNKRKSILIQFSGFTEEMLHFTMCLVKDLHLRPFTILGTLL